MSTNQDAPLFHGKFIPDEQDRLPLAARLGIGAGFAVVLPALALLCLNVLNSWGVWVTLAIVSALSAVALTAWIRDEVRHPPTQDDGEPEDGDTP